MSMIIAQTPNTYFGSDIQKSLDFHGQNTPEKNISPVIITLVQVQDEINSTSPPTYELIDQDKEQIIGIREEKLTELETKHNDNSEIVTIQKQLLNLVDKTQLENLKSLISKLDDKITKK
ncbi:hypothetical protein LOTGIDRAFT_171414 [Lottia gigantea]|uniref:Uncharacterized protein n=1 Tax=Lottia gigantea TaxID=225164 RepID=V4BBP5_LOTGI|nr:hypothetical protein LOTGIDRAFT_171414 [Lottia gigantea]ESP03477.1 hypothetical protein LOTGIDRAFT_171414 [Lottia gigantea]